MMGAVGGNAELRSSMDAFSRVHRHRNMDAILNDFRSILQESAPPAAFTTGMFINEELYKLWNGI